MRVRRLLHATLGARACLIEETVAGALGGEDASEASSVVALDLLYRLTWVSRADETARNRRGVSHE